MRGIGDEVAGGRLEKELMREGMGIRLSFSINASRDEPGVSDLAQAGRYKDCLRIESSSFLDP